MIAAAARAMLRGMTAARKLDPAAAEHDPVWAAALAAPLFTESLPEDEIAAFNEAMADDGTGHVEMIPGEQVHADVERAARAMERFGEAGERAEVTLGEVLRCLDTGEPSPVIAALLAAERAAAAE
jgi:hypothetical protein